MIKNRLIKSLIGMVGIYLVLLAFILIWNRLTRYHRDWYGLNSIPLIAAAFVVSCLIQRANMKKKTLLKSLIGTVGIYLVLMAFILIFRDKIDFLVYLPVYIGTFAACSIAAGLLFKGQIYAWMWLAATVIFYVAMWGLELEGLFTGTVLFLYPLLIPFFIVKAIFLSIKEEKKEKSGLE